MKRAGVVALMAMLSSCSGSHEAGGGLVVKQVLQGSQAQPAPGPAAPLDAGSTPPPVPGMSLGSTLVADTPRALYRRAYDQSRRRADGQSARERLAAVDDFIDQAQQEQLNPEQE